jgi:uncharacterized sodium:solute symporter family permease YidK
METSKNNQIKNNTANIIAYALPGLLLPLLTPHRLGNGNIQRQQKNIILIQTKQIKTHTTTTDTVFLGLLLFSLKGKTRRIFI